MGYELFCRNNNILKYVMGCHGNHAFYIAQAGFYDNLFRISVVLVNNLAPMKHCPWGTRLAKLTPDYMF